MSPENEPADASIRKDRPIRDDQHVRERRLNVKDDEASDPIAPTSGQADVESSEKLLHHLSLMHADGSADGASLAINPNISRDGLKLSGRAISAVFCIPYHVEYRKEADWHLSPRRGTSSFFDSLAYMSSPESSWDHTIVGWTGEIKTAATSSEHMQDGTREYHAASAPSSWQDRTAKPHEHELTLSRSDREKLEQQLEHNESGKILPVWLTDEVPSESGMVIVKDQARWRRYAEHEIFTLFHDEQREPSIGREEQTGWADYHRMNTAFADRIMEVYKRGDVVIIHDYHLLLLPAILRQRCPGAYIGFFLHIPFPSSEHLRCLSRRNEILQGVLGANLVGFQSFGFKRHFISCCQRILRLGSTPAYIDAYGAHVAVGMFSIGIDAASTRRKAFEDPEVEAKKREIRKTCGDRKIILALDRLDTVPGVVQKLEAFGIFLDVYPEWRGRVVLIQVTNPTSVEEEREDGAKKTTNRVAELVSRINGRYGDLSYSPVQHFFNYISSEEYFALLRIANVGLVTSVRDGMNTTALQYVVCQEGSHGALLISEFSGTAGGLDAAIQINTALNMSLEEKEEQHRKLYDYLTKNTIQSCSTNFLTKVLNAISSTDEAVVTPLLDKPALLTSFRKAKKRLFMFDYDGTLTPIVKDPQSAIPSERVIRTLRILSSDPRNHVWIISGRDQAFLDQWLGHIPHLGFSAEHGCFLRQPESSAWENVTEKTDMSWQEEVVKIMEHFTEKTPGSFIERKKVALTWHYRAAEPDLGVYQAGECRAELEQTVGKSYEVEVMAGKANLEVRPRFVNKGEIAKQLIAEGSDVGKEDGTDTPLGTLHVSARPDFVFCLGDDLTDEDMFRALNASDLPKEEVFACAVGPSSKRTVASWHLLEPSDVISAVEMLNCAADDNTARAEAMVDGAVDGVFPAETRGGE